MASLTPIIIRCTISWTKLTNKTNFFCCSADLIDEKDLEDGEIFEDEDPETETKTVTAPLQEKPKHVAKPVATPEKTLETDNSIRYQEKLEKPKRELPFFNKGKRKLLDDDEESRRWKRDEKVRTKFIIYRFSV